MWIYNMKWWHSSAVVSTVPSQQEGPGFESTGPSCTQPNYRSDKKISKQSRPHKLRRTLKSITFVFLWIWENFPLALENLYLKYYFLSTGKERKVFKITVRSIICWIKTKCMYLCSCTPLPPHKSNNQDVTEVQAFRFNSGGLTKSLH